VTSPTDLSAPGRRERKKLETRAALEQAALRLFAEKGYEQTTVEEIAEAADVAVRTFFRYFSSKQHVLFGDAAHDRIQRMRAELAARPADEPILTSLRAVLELLDIADPLEQREIMQRVRLMERQPSLIGTYLQLNYDLRRVVAEFVADRTGRTIDRDPYALTVASAVASSWDIALTVWAATDGRRPLQVLRREIMDTLTAGISEPPRGRAAADDGGRRGG